jgi:hypothetical protein
MNILCIEYFCPQQKHNRTLLFGRILKHYWNQPLNMRISVCYLDCHVAGLCCYLVIHTENLLQLFYFHLWPIYWLSLVYNKSFKEKVIELPYMYRPFDIF